MFIGLTTLLGSAVPLVGIIGALIGYFLKNSGKVKTAVKEVGDVVTDLQGKTDFATLAKDIKEAASAIAAFQDLLSILSPANPLPPVGMELRAQAPPVATLSVDAVEELIVRLAKRGVTVAS